MDMVNNGLLGIVLLADVSEKSVFARVCGGFIWFALAVLAVFLVGYVIYYLCDNYCHIEQLVLKRKKAKAERTKKKTLFDKYKTGMVIGKFSENPYKEGDYMFVASEKTNINGEKYVEVVKCNLNGDYDDSSEKVVYKSETLDDLGYIVVKNV